MVAVAVALVTLPGAEAVAVTSIKTSGDRFGLYSFIRVCFIHQALQKAGKVMFDTVQFLRGFTVLQAHGNETGAHAGNDCYQDRHTHQDKQNTERYWQWSKDDADNDDHTPCDSFDTALKHWTFHTDGKHMTFTQYCCEVVNIKEITLSV